MERRFYTLDVFTTTRFEGNPLAVITDGDGLSDDAMLAIAREMNLSETVFVQKPTEDNALARLRIFTTQQELKLAGPSSDRHMVSSRRTRRRPRAGRRRSRFSSKPAREFCPSKFASKRGARNASR